MPKIPKASWLDIHPWVETSAPGAGDAACVLSNDPKLSALQRKRLQNLIGEQTQSAWQKLPKKHWQSKRLFDPKELYDAQHELLVTAFYAADLEPIGQPEIELSKQRLAAIGKAAGKLAREIRNTGADACLTARWRLYRYKYYEVLQALPEYLPDVAKMIHRLGDFFTDAAPHYKISPVTPVGQPLDKDARRTTAIYEIAKVTHKHFGTALLGKVATFASVSLNEDIRTETVRSSLRGKILA